MAAFARPAVMTSVGSTVHIGAFISHTALFLQLRQRAASLSQRDRNADDLDVRWVSVWGTTIFNTCTCNTCVHVCVLHVVCNLCIPRVFV